jgi:transcriptional regulator with XRE-family HTH domain
MNIGEKIRLARTIRGYSQEYMAQQMKITQKTYSQIENNQTKIDVEKLKEITSVLELDLEKLLSLDESNIFNNTYHNNAENYKNISVLYQNESFEKERVLYEKQIKLLETELVLLREERATLIKLLDK